MLSGKKTQTKTKQKTIRQTKEQNNNNNNNQKEQNNLTNK